MRIAAWNIRHGGGRRIGAIQAELARHAAEVVVLTETRGSAPTMALRAALNTEGFRYQHTPGAPGNGNSVLIASRLPLAHRPIRSLPPPAASRVTRCSIGGLDIVALYFPAVAPDLLHFFDLLLPLMARWCARPTLLIGDFNTGINGADAKGAPFSAAPRLQRLMSDGWTDGWRHLNGDRREYTWYSHLGNGFRIDHAWLSPAALPLLRRAEYHHEGRVTKASDHSVLVVEMRE